ncbi:Crp/Fnr family transcriptional regulator [Enterococcus phoeniculicola]|jgi:CRP-like cAMP-binding protein|uniref:CRP/FNR family transcriptional regulator, anaerobic regulatory protein n=1 Tax=Enterococcus phoeniculicola ATCC BAA-412 TaxID=1158610 RepID=R3WDM4_9ENTE|nr:Crp/Fnr family transcriptional regulator [Enterococcus phoeniculicola]EOL45537.1 CRP/FNR family transcriptional regulator, anaerobic regulatory protein [Enterococcus phoeniculicola ATCC BAA-412]EOT74899.1 CRP/FNR family transcriptional regulator, anaerobic regulatory protein [Enterococcus phoeniculicola ATCC BAA-412]
MNKEHLCVTLVPLFNHLELDEQKKINQLVTHRFAEKGEQIFTPESDAQLIIVARGALKVYQLSASGKEQLLRVVEPGGYEGENQLFGAVNEVIFGEALEKTEICILKKSDFTELLLKYPQITLKLLEINADKSLTLEQQTQFLMMEKVEERLATYLLNLGKATRKSQVHLPMKMKELAAFLGTTPETLSRKFKLLEEANLIIREKKEVELIDWDGLEDISLI